MPYTTLTLVVSNGNASTSNTTYTYSKTNTSWADATKVIASIDEFGGIFDDNNVWYPKTSIIRVTAG